MLGSVQPGWDRAVRSPHGKVLEGCEDQPKDCESHPANTEAISMEDVVVILARGISRAGLFSLLI